MSYDRHVGGFLVFPVCGVWLNLQHLRFFPTFLWPFSYACWANFGFFKDTLDQVIFVYLNGHFQRTACFADETSATITWDAVHTLLPLLDISNRSSFHQRPTKCLFSFESSPDVETVSNTSEFLGDPPNIRDNDSALVCCILRWTVASRWLHYGVNEFLWVFIKHHIISYILNLLVEMFLILTCMTLARLIRLWTTPFFTWCGWLCVLNKNRVMYNVQKYNICTQEELDSTEKSERNLPLWKLQISQNFSFTKKLFHEHFSNIFIKIIEGIIFETLRPTQLSNPASGTRPTS
jgi:hypothetical protein